MIHLGNPEMCRGIQGCKVVSWKYEYGYLTVDT